MKQITKRLKDGEDLRQAIQNLAAENNIKAGVILSMVGSLKKAHLRMAGAKTSKQWEEEFEIVSGTGTLSAEDLHIHITISDVNATVYGGHLKEGCIVRTTCELVVLAFDDVTYKRAPDENTGYDELAIE